MLQSLKRNIFFLRPIRSIKKIVLWFCLLFVTTLTVVDGCAKLPDGDGLNSNTGTAGTLRRAVSDWIAGGTPRSTVVALYGPIEDWDTSDVSNMNNVFYGVGLYATFRSFNADISKWNMGAVTAMSNSKYLLNSTQKNIYTLRLIQLTVFLFHAVAFLCSIYSCTSIQR
jgi:hypothetical protein